MENNKIPVQIGNEEIIAQGKMHQIIQKRMQIGTEVKVFESAERAPGVRLIIITENQILLSKEWRSEQNCWDYRLPGGKVFDSLEELNAFRHSSGNILIAAETAAKKESEEEVGIKVLNMELLKKTVCGATIDWDLYYFVVREFHYSDSGQNLEFGENITSNWFTFEEAKELALKGEMKEERSIGVLLQFLYKNNLIK